MANYGKIFSVMFMVRNRLKDIRHDMKIDYQADMARLLGLSQFQYNRYERQKAQPTLEIALRMAQKLNLPVEQIFYISPE